MSQDELIRRFVENGQRAQAAVNLQIAKAELRKLGITLTQRPGQYQVNLTGGPDENALTAETLEDAVQLGIDMAKTFPPATPAHFAAKISPGKEPRGRAIDWVPIFGQAGILTLAALVGASDIDPFVLNLAQGGAPDMGITALAAAVLIAASANNLAKAVYAIGFGGLAAAGTARLRRSGSLPRLSEGRYRIDAAVKQWWFINSAQARIPWSRPGPTDRSRPRLMGGRGNAKQALRDKLIEHKQYITRHGNDMPEVKDWRLPAPRAWGARKIESKLPPVAKCSSETLPRDGFEAEEAIE